MSALSVTQLHYRVDDGLALSLEVQAGECLHLAGQEGSGRSRFFKALMGWRAIAGGQIALFDQAIDSLPIEARARLGLGLVADTSEVFSLLSVKQNLQLANWQKRPTRAELQTFIAHIPALAARLDAPAAALSGGEKKLLALARGLFSGARVLLLDEPTLGLSQESSGLVTTLLNQFLASHPSHTLLYSGAELPRLGLTPAGDRRRRVYLNGTDFASELGGECVDLMRPALTLE